MNLFILTSLYILTIILTHCIIAINLSFSKNCPKYFPFFTTKWPLNHPKIASVPKDQIPQLESIYLYACFFCTPKNFIAPKECKPDCKDDSTDWYDWTKDLVIIWRALSAEHK